MSNRIAFQTQLASIMEVLANAAVAEICKLVDDDYAVINLQMTQCQRENKALKRKLHILELKMARGLAERRIGSLSRANRVHVTAAAAALTDKYRNQNNDVAFGGQFNAGLWSDAGSDAGGEQKPLGVSNSLTGETISDIENVLIKVEAFEEAPTQQNIFMGDCGLAASPSQTVNEVGDDQVSRMQRQTLEVSGSDTALKSELKVVDVKGKSPERFDLNGESSPQGDYVSRDSDGSNFPHPPCAHGNDTRAASRPSRQSEVIEVDSADDGEEITAWTRKPVDPFPPSTLSHFGKNDVPDGRMLLPSFNPHLTSADLVAVASSSKTPAPYFHRNIQHANLNQQAFGRMGNDKVPCEKRFACTYCGKVFNRPKKVVIHQRIHTGEKPFKCLTCGKLFAEAGNLRKHQKVHTGERPYSCSQCGQAFAWIRNLKSHQQKYHSEMLRAEEHLAAVSHI